ncbi:MAG: thioredoxin-disulfide reductase [Lachnospiraceae bacterium]|nr:thioredoxin-disulfide reductase [Lachnospiraceae bacterium]
MKQEYDVIIIGGGPAGMTAAIYAKRAALSTLVIEKQPFCGGQVLNTYEVDNYPGLPGIDGYSLSEKFQGHAKNLEAEFYTGEMTDLLDEGETKTVVLKKGERFKAKGVVLALGAVHRKAMVPGEEELAGKGVSYCATCDGAFFRKKTVAVIGGGDVALEDAIFLARACKKVYLIHRRDELRGAKILQQKLLSMDNVEICWNSVVEEIVGDGLVNGIHLSNKKTGEKTELLVDGVFVAIGTIPDTKALEGIVDLDEQGYIIAAEDGATSMPGVFCGGDCRTKQLRQIITSAADGANCIFSLEQYLSTR